MTQQLGEILVSQSVKAYKASMVLSELVPGARLITISTLPEVLSSTFFTLIFPLSIALTIDSMTLEVVFPKGISRMTNVLLSSFSILARIRTVPPRRPSLYLETSILPPV